MARRSARQEIRQHTRGYGHEQCSTDDGQPFRRRRCRDRALLLRAYRWQYIVSGVQHPHFGRLLTGMTTQAQMGRIQAALAPIFNL